MLTRYFIHSTDLQLFVGGVKAKTLGEAQAMAKEFGPYCTAVRLRDVRGYTSNTVTWNDGSFWVKDSAYGCIYVCHCCAKKTLGHGSHNHYPYCPMNPKGALNPLQRKHEEGSFP